MAFFNDPTSHKPRAPSNPRLLKALHAVSGSEDAQVRHGLYEALINSTILVPTLSPEPDSKKKRDPDLLMVEDERGAMVVPAFTDLQALQRWQPGALAFVAVPVLQFLRESFPSTASGIWLNIADRSSRFVSRGELSQIAGSMVAPTYAEQVAKDLTPAYEDFKVEPVAPLPGELVSRVIAACRREADVAQAFVMNIPRGQGRARLAVGVRFARLLEDVQIDAVLKRIATSINTGRSRRKSIEVLPLDFKRYGVVKGAVAPVYDQD